MVMIEEVVIGRSIMGRPLKQVPLESICEKLRNGFYTKARPVCYTESVLKARENGR